MRVRQHIPDFISGVEPEVADVADLVGLLALDWVKRWQHSDFARWSIAEDYRPHAEWLLMAEMNDGKSSWVVAYLGEDIPELPRWSKK